MDVRIIKTPDPRCDTFVLGRPEGTISYLSTWSSAVAEATGLKEFYLAAFQGEDICGVLPLMHIRSRFFGNQLVSQAFCNYGGVLADSEAARDVLFYRAVDLAVELGCEFVELRNIKPLPYELHSVTNKMCMHLPLTADPEDLWKSFKPKVRNQVRKAKKAGILAGSGRLELLNDFYRVYTMRMRQLGSPCFSRKLMCTILELFSDNCRIFVVHRDKLTVGAGFVTSYNGFVEIPWAATLLQYNALCPNNLLYWTIIEHYCLAGARSFDFGRCTVDSSTYRFKKQWGPEPVNLNYQYWVKPGWQLSIPDADDPKYKWKVEMWKKLPLWLTRLLGPCISRNLPR
jgi:FemAB-related protein (PEP-CTERM system-associated)